MNERSAGQLRFTLNVLDSMLASERLEQRQTALALASDWLRTTLAHHDARQVGQMPQLDRPKRKIA